MNQNITFWLRFPSNSLIQEGKITGINQFNHLKGDGFLTFRHLKGADFTKIRHLCRDSSYLCTRFYIYVSRERFNKDEFNYRESDLQQDRTACGR